jgi:hypothetical protein
MKSSTFFKTILSAITLIICSTVLSIAQPANPGGDPYAAPVDGGIVCFLVAAFLFGGYKVYKINKNTRGANIKG